MKQSGRRIAAVVLALVLAAAGMAGCRISRTRAMTDKERTACEAYTISFPEEVLGDKTLAETILSLCTAQEETEHGTVYDGVALQPYLYQCSEVTEVVSSMDRPMHLNVSYKTQDDIEASLEIDYDVIVLRSVYYPEEDAYALEQMGPILPVLTYDFIDEAVIQFAVWHIHWHFIFLHKISAQQKM